MTDSRLLLAVARILRAAAEEAERCASEVASSTRQPAEIRTSGRPVSELGAQRARAALRRAGILADL